jgi:cardiolipin synthase
MAARRGADVRIILPSRPDLHLLGVAMYSYFGMALRSGIRIYLYQPTVLHAKSVICDSSWATFGSMNWDSVSFRFNLEANIATTSSACIAELARQFEVDVTNSKELSYEEWQQRPYTRRIMEALLWPIHGLL